MYRMEKSTLHGKLWCILMMVTSIANLCHAQQTVINPSDLETGWAEFTSFAYEGRDRLFERVPPSATEYYNPIAPHIFRHNGWYYLTCAEGGTGPNHSQVIFRTRSLDEPFVPGPHNPILTQRDLDRNRPNPVTALGHADLVETPAGEWWAVFLGIRPYQSGMSNIGRETFLLPATWENDWPTILEPGKVMPRVVKRPKLPTGQKLKVPTTGSFSWSDEFSDKQLGLLWMFLRNPREQWWSLTARPGSLLIAPRSVNLNSINRKDVDVNGNPSFIARRQQHHDFSARTTISVNPTTVDSESGLAALQNSTNYFFLGVRIKEGKAQQIFLEQHAEQSTAPEIVTTVPLPVGTKEIELRMTGAGRDYSFSYRIGNSPDWQTLTDRVDGSILSTQRAGGFVGAVLGMYARSLSATETTASLSEAETAARNPIIWADVPDLAMIRVGDTYYMSSTTMHMSPGLPIMKSKDLMNWRLVSYAYDTLEDNDALTLQNGQNSYGRGSWASSLRYHQSTFYVSTFSSTTGKTHIYTTKDIEKGPWTEISFRPSLHDHSLFFDDDGRVYMIHGGGNLRLTELNADLSGLKPGGVDQVVVPNASLIAGPNIGLQAEGSQLLKHNGKYYLFNITWPRGGMRTVLVHRADKITGPYEGRMALQDKGVAQGSLIDTPQGEWFAYLFRDYGAVGRIPYVVPVKWEDGWPVLGVDGKVPDTLNLPASKGLMPGIVASDEFGRSPGQPALPLAWQWNHNPDNRYWSLTQRPGFLRLTTGRVDADFRSARNSLTQRTFGPESSGTVAMDVSNMQDGDSAGLAVLQRRYGFVGVKMAGDAKSIVMVSADSGSPQEVQSVPLTQNTVFLKVDCDYRNRADKAYFLYSLDGNQWTPLGKPLQMAYTIPHFMGYRFALFNYATKSAGGFVDFDYLRISDKIGAVT